jgi:hypothetical protein
MPLETRQKMRCENLDVIMSEDQLIATTLDDSTVVALG